MTTASLRKPLPTGVAPKTLPEILSAYERIVIIQALQLNDCSRSKTAASLGVSRRYLYRRLAILRIDLPSVTMGRSGRTGSTKKEEGD